MAKRPLSNTQLEEHFKEQIQFLQRSADSFDKGHDSEAKRMAVSIRILVHETKNSHSLLGQLNKLNEDFYSTALDNIEGNHMPYNGLIMVKMGIKENGNYIAMLDDSPEKPRIMSFEKWWEEIIFNDNNGIKLSRKDVVLTSANQDGGAHVDPGLEEEYAKLAKDNAMGWSYQRNDEETQPILGIEKVAIRQITHEILKTLVPNYEKKREDKKDGIIFGGLQLISEKMARTLKWEKVKFANVGRNDKCPCDSGRKFKKCHGK